MRPLLAAHGGRIGDFPMNSLEGIRDALARNVDMIEVDVRRSRDGVLFCYHGSVFEYFFTPFVQKTYREIEAGYAHAPSLRDVAVTVGRKVILALDVKDFSIRPEELEEELDDIPLKEVWILAQDWKYHAQAFPPGWKRIYNGCFFASLKRARACNLDGIELPFWDFFLRRRKFENAGLGVALFWFLLPKGIYRMLVRRSLWVALDIEEDLRFCLQRYR